jgi:hypothetical protein
VIAARRQQHFGRVSSSVYSNPEVVVTAPAGETQQDDPKADPKGEGQAEKTFTQAQLNSFLASQKRDIESKFDGFDDIKAKAAQLDALTESTKSEVQRANETAAEFKTRSEAVAAEKANLETRLLRQEIAAAEGLPASMWKRVQGTTQEEITSDVKELLASAGPAGKPPRSGPSGSGASAGNADDPKGSAVRALRAMRDSR